MGGHSLVDSRSPCAHCGCWKVPRRGGVDTLGRTGRCCGARPDHRGFRASPLQKARIGRNAGSSSRDLVERGSGADATQGPLEGAIVTGDGIFA